MQFALSPDRPGPLVAEIALDVDPDMGADDGGAGFQVIETGGESFDNEVIRVLKKMPKWIPGKTNGETVSAYFVVPVKFTSSN